jgi:hypothetical protein
MNLPRQSRPVIREMSRDSIRARVGGAQPPSQIAICLGWCRVMCQRNYPACEMRCHAGLPAACP